MNEHERTGDEVLREGMDALFDRLGAAAAIRFLQHYSNGQGDYTRDRSKWLGAVTLDEILVSAEKLARERPRKPA